jgi:hypothetical protein
LNSDLKDSDSGFAHEGRDVPRVSQAERRMREKSPSQRLTEQMRKTKEMGEAGADLIAEHNGNLEGGYGGLEDGFDLGEFQRDVVAAVEMGGAEHGVREKGPLGRQDQSRLQSENIESR